MGTSGVPVLHWLCHHAIRRIRSTEKTLPSDCRRRRRHVLGSNDDAVVGRQDMAGGCWNSNLDRLWRRIHSRRLTLPLHVVRAGRPGVTRCYLLQYVDASRRLQWTHRVRHRQRHRQCRSILRLAMDLDH